MYIANPIYDSVFKYLLEDTEIAKGLLSAIIGSEIVSLQLQPQETLVETNPSSSHTDAALLRIYRIDFAAVVQQADGSHKKILIELQKTKRSTNIGRFRLYLAENYRRNDTITTPDGKRSEQPLEIVTIYFLGFKLEPALPAMLYGNMCFRDLSTGELVANAKESDFVRLLNHESYTIQIPKLPKISQTRLEQLLSVFNQHLQTNDHHTLLYTTQQQHSDPLLQQMLHRLTRARASDDMRRKMDIEDEIEQDYQDIDKKYGTIIKEQRQQLEEQSQQLEEKEQQLEVKEQQLEEKEQQLEEQSQQLVEKEQQLAEQDRLIALLKQQLLDKKP